jgi:flavin-dependent dehydrogenase
MNNYATLDEAAHMLALGRYKQFHSWPLTSTVTYTVWVNPNGDYAHVVTVGTRCYLHDIAADWATLKPFEEAADDKTQDAGGEIGDSALPPTLQA